MNQGAIWARNSAALSTTDPGLLSGLSYLPSWPGAGMETARSGESIPFLLREGRRRALHSSFQPRAEAKRLRASLPASGYFACLGLAGGYLAAELLSGQGCERLLCVEHSAEFLSFCLSNMDLSAVLADPRFRLLLDPPEALIEEEVLSSYLPQLSGGISLASLRARVDADPEAFAADARALRRGMDRVAADFSVQARFGRRWFLNALRNLPAASQASREPPRSERAIVCAAGPSLEKALPELGPLQASGALLIATDTSLPALLAASLKPDAVVSMDCQHWSCMHFLKGLPQESSLFLDLSSPPPLARLGADRRHFFASGHPFIRHLGRAWKAFPELDCSGGNVGQAALSLALSLGAREIRLYGADLSYPAGASYARGTWLHDWFASGATRLSPLEAQFSALLHRGGSLEREDDDEGFRYLSPALKAYRESLEALIPRLGATILRERGGGVELHPLPPKPGRPLLGSIPFQATGRASRSPAAFLRDYAGTLERLRLPQGPLHPALMAMDEEERGLWMTLLPLAAAASLPRLRGEGCSGRDAVEEARRFSIDEARKAAARFEREGDL